MKDKLVLFTFLTSNTRVFILIVTRLLRVSLRVNR